MTKKPWDDIELSDEPGVEMTRELALELAGGDEAVVERFFARTCCTHEGAAMTECEHVWKSVPGTIYGLRRCEKCQTLARQSNKSLKIHECKVCKAPAKHMQLSFTYCDAHLVTPGNLRTLKDMTPEERKALEAKYGAPIKPKT